MEPASTDCFSQFVDHGTCKIGLLITALGCSYLLNTALGDLIDIHDGCTAAFGRFPGKGTDDGQADRRVLVYGGIDHFQKMIFHVIASVELVLIQRFHFKQWSGICFFLETMQSVIGIFDGIVCKSIDTCGNGILYMKNA